MAKQELEWFDPMTNGKWFHPEGYPEGVMQMIIAKCPDTGVQTSMSIWPAGTKDTRVLSHDTWEECYMIEGSQVCNGRVISAGMVTVRPPNMPHGPFESPNGCRTFEVYYK